MDRIRLNQLSAAAIFKIGFFCLLAVLLPFMILCGLLAMGGSNTVMVNGRYVHGVGGLIASLVLGVVMPAVLAGLMTLGGLIARLFGGMLPGLRLRGGARD